MHNRYHVPDHSILSKLCVSAALKGREILLYHAWWDWIIVGTVFSCFEKYVKYPSPRKFDHQFSSRDGRSLIYLVPHSSLIFWCCIFSRPGEIWRFLHVQAALEHSFQRYILQRIKSDWLGRLSVGVIWLYDACTKLAKLNVWYCLSSV